MEDMAHVPTFHTSLVSYKSFERAGGSWDTQTKSFMHDGELFCRVLDRHEQPVVESTPGPLMELMIAGLA